MTHALVAILFVAFATAATHRMRPDRCSRIEIWFRVSSGRPVRMHDG
jgi:hypothetical protein